MKITPRLFSSFRNPRPTLRWVTLLSLGGAVLVLAFIIVVTQTTNLQARSFFSVKPQVLPVPVKTSDYFQDERLQAYAGQEFNLAPDLVDFLDQLEERINTAVVRKKSSLPDVSPYTQFVNPSLVQFRLYCIKNKDNYWKVAKESGYTIDTIVGCNPFLERVVCYSGQWILLPSIGGCLHQVQPGDTLETIALNYSVSAEKILEANTISSPWDLIPDMWIFIPWAKPRQLSNSMQKEYAKRALFRSPLAGRYTSFVGMRVHPVLGFSKFHSGVDIACKLNSWVGASAEGTVIEAGSGGSLGKFVKIDHHNGYITVYGHLNKVLVSSGRQIKKGQLIGMSGATGRVTGPHLHYAIYRDGRVVDPMDFLW
jgi:hypothetical protein